MRQPRRPARRAGGALAAVLVGLAALTMTAATSFASTPASKSGGSASSWVTSTSSSGCPSAACSQVLQDVTKAVKTTSVPSSLTPSLKASTSDILFPPTMAGCGGGVSGVTQPLCEDGKASAPRIALLGDSEAQTWSIAFDAIARRTGYSLLALAKTECPVAQLSILIPYDNKPYTTCAQFTKYAIGRINKYNPQIVVVATLAMQFENLKGKNVTASQYQSGVVKVLKELAHPGRKIFVVGDPPHQNVSPPVCLAAHESGIQSCTGTPKEALQSFGMWQEALRSAAQQAGATYIDVFPWFCTTKACPPVIAGTEVYLDYGHMTSTYGVYLSGVMQAALGMKDLCTPSTKCNHYSSFQKYSYYTPQELSSLSGS